MTQKQVLFSGIPGGSWLRALQAALPRETLGLRDLGEVGERPDLAKLWKKVESETGGEDWKTGLVPFDFAKCKKLLSEESSPVQLVLFWESAESWLAENLGELAGRPEPTNDPADLLKPWLDVGKQLLSLAQGYPGKVFLLSLEECIKHAAAAGRLLGDVVGVRMDATEFSMASWDGESQLFERILAGLIAGKSSVQKALYLELQVSSIPLPGVEASLPPELEVSEIWEGTRCLLADGCTDLKRIGELAEENELLLKNLHEVQEQLEEKLVAESQVDPGGGTAATLVRENQMLLHQLAQLQKELEERPSQGLLPGVDFESFLPQGFSAEPRRFFQSAIRPYRARIVGGLDVQYIECIHFHEHPTHRHVDFSFQYAECMERGHRELLVRIAEHEGRPGLVFLKRNGENEAPLYRWQPDGEENGGEFQLVFPSNEKIWEWLRFSNAHDFCMVLGTAEILLEFLQNPDPDEQGKIPLGERRRWIFVARQLVDRFREIPPHPHYDAVEGSLPEAPGAPLVTSVRHLVFESRAFQNFRFEWQPPVGDNTAFPTALTFFLDSESAPPLDFWPRNSSGVLLPQWKERWLGGSESQENSQSWAQFTEKDRALVIALFAEMPNFIHHIATRQEGVDPALVDGLAQQAKICWREIKRENRTDRKKPKFSLRKLFGIHG